MEKKINLNRLRYDVTVVLNVLCLRCTDVQVTSRYLLGADLA